MLLRIVKIVLPLRQKKKREIIAKYESGVSRFESRQGVQPKNRLTGLRLIAMGQIDLGQRFRESKSEISLCPEVSNVVKLNMN